MRVYIEDKIKKSKVKLIFRFLILLYKFKSQKYNFSVFSLKNYPISGDYYLILAGGRNVSDMIEDLQARVSEAIL